MKTAISLPDALFARAEELAKLMGKPRSRLYADALREYLERHESEAITESWNAALKEVGETDDAFVGYVARVVAEHTEW